MPCYMYVSLQDDDKILVFTMDTGTGKLVRGIGLHSMGANGSLQPFDWCTPYRTVIPNWVYRCMRALIIGGQQKPAIAICG